VVRGEKNQFGEFLFMSKYVVVWAEPGELSPVKNKKFFDAPSTAYWFANELKKKYNWVICTESKNLEE
jgi:hypothetical protein